MHRDPKTCIVCHKSTMQAGECDFPFCPYDDTWQGNEAMEGAGAFKPAPHASRPCEDCGKDAFAQLGCEKDACPARKPRTFKPIPPGEGDFWIPMTDPVDIKHIGKAQEEMNELGGALSRALIQGIDEHDPDTGIPNRQSIQDELADVLCMLAFLAQRFKLDPMAIRNRSQMKQKRLAKWFADLEKYCNGKTNKA